MAAIVDEIRMLFEESGASMYAGEPVTQTEHALQAAELGRLAGASDALVAAARKAGEAQSTACIVVFTTLGGTARRMARERPLHTVLALTPNPDTARRLALVWGLEPRLGRQPDSLEQVTDDAVAGAMDYGLAQPGQRILILAGTPFGAPGAANLLRLAHAPSKAKRARKT